MVKLMLFGNNGESRGEVTEGGGRDGFYSREELER